MEPTTAESRSFTELSDSLVAKLIPWLFQQPEWPLLMSASREARKAVGHAVGKTISRLPASGALLRLGVEQK